MADTTTTNYSLTKPEVGASEDTWGTKLNTNLDTIDTTLFGKVDESGDTMTGDLNFGDNVKAQFGAGSDLQIYHDGNHSYVKDTGTGNLFLDADGILYVRGNNASENMARFNANGAVELFHNDALKLATTSTGVDVTGGILSTTGWFGLDATDNLQFTNNSRIDFYINNSNEFRMESDGDFHADGDVIAYSTTVSDERLKDNIVGIDGALDKVSQLNGYTFSYKADGKISAGVIAQEVEKVLPEAVSEKELPLKADDGQQYKVVNYDALHGLLIEAIKELKAEIEVLKGAK